MIAAAGRSLSTIRSAAPSVRTANHSSISSYTTPIVNPDGSNDILFGPNEPAEKSLDQDRSGKGLLPDVQVLWA